MSKITFSSNDIDILNKNTNVLRVSEKTITYTDEFKRNFIEKYLRGKLPHVIFEEAGFDLNMIGYKCAEKSAARCLIAYNQNGIIVLCDTRT